MSTQIDPLASYLERIRACFPALNIGTAQLNRDGLINDVVIIDEALVARFAKDEWGRSALDQETRILDLVRLHLDLPVPHFDHREEDFVTYRFLPAIPAPIRRRGS